MHELTNAQPAAADPPVPATEQSAPVPHAEAAWEFFRSLGSPRYHVAPMVSTASTRCRRAIACSAACYSCQQVCIRKRSAARRSVPAGLGPSSLAVGGRTESFPVPAAPASTAAARGGSRRAARRQRGIAPRLCSRPARASEQAFLASPSRDLPPAVPSPLLPRRWTRASSPSGCSAASMVRAFRPPARRCPRPMTRPQPTPRSRPLHPPLSKAPPARTLRCSTPASSSRTPGTAQSTSPRARCAANAARRGTLSSTCAHPAAWRWLPHLTPPDPPAPAGGPAAARAVLRQRPGHAPRRGQARGARPSLRSRPPGAAGATAHSKLTPCVPRPPLSLRRRRTATAST